METQERENIIRGIIESLKKDNFFTDKREWNNVRFYVLDAEHLIFVYIDDSCREKFITIEINEEDGEDAWKPMYDLVGTSDIDEQKFENELRWLLKKI